MRRAIVLLTAGALLLGGLWVFTAPAAIPEDLLAVDGTGVATPLAIISKVPATSEGGVSYSTTQLTVDKATAKAASFTLGDLVESFLEISDRPLDDKLPDPTGMLPDLTLDPTTEDPNDHLGKYQPPETEYKSPVIVKAQYPPSADQAVPESSEALGGAVRAYANQAPLSHAEAHGGKTTVAGVLEIGAGSSSSQSELLGNGTVVTTAIAEAKNVVVGGIVNLASVTSRAITRVPASGDGETELKIVVSGVLVGGVPARLTNDGLELSDQVPVSPAQLVAFNEGIAALDATGIAIRAFPGVVRKVDASSAEAAGAGLSVHYNFTGQGLPGSGLGDAPYDEEFVIGKVKSRSVARHRTTRLGTDLSELPDLDVLAGDFTSSTDDGFGLGGSELGSGAATGSVASSPGGNDDLNLVRSRAVPVVARLRDFYRLIMALALIGALTLLARRRTRLS